MIDITKLSQGEKEKIRDYHARVLELRRKLDAQIRKEGLADELMNGVDNLLCKHFILGMKPEIRRVKYDRPATIEQAKEIARRQEESMEEEPKEIVAKVEPTPAPLVQNPQPLLVSTNISPSTSTEYEDLLKKMGQLTINLLQGKEFNSQGGDRGPKRNISEVVCYGCYKKGHYKYNCPDRASTSGKGDNDKGKAHVNSFDVVDKSRNNEVDVFVTKRKKEKDNQDGNDPKKMKE
ncbi:hypothetical protein KI387_038562 [Taxus chinensis]|uniref:CCHC-type domain-containing protein n=1 Tax=Taxus chinensis TaxID=29808 RepID=A0AA38CDF9_TAXCH|nr:hypothetical protein KI387_038562 [Taxus chinensis]